VLIRVFLGWLRGEPTSTADRTPSKNMSRLCAGFGTSGLESLAAPASSPATAAHCRYPGCKATSGLEVDHIVPLALGGRDRGANPETLCAAHHLQKTRQDARPIAKARRAGAEHRGAPSKSKLFESAVLRGDRRRRTPPASACMPSWTPSSTSRRRRTR
jgi:5-methylcytosine-specific restriction endonuclease McrA